MQRPDRPLWLDLNLSPRPYHGLNNIWTKTGARAFRGGFPTPALQLTTKADRRIWFDGYVRTYLERDLQDLATISALPDFRRLMRAICLRMGQLVNQAELGRDLFSCAFLFLARLFAESGEASLKHSVIRTISR